MSRRLWRAALLMSVALWAASTWAQGTPRAADNILTGIGQATWIGEGGGARIVYIFFDPNCPYCHRLYQDLRPWVGRDALQFRWIPVGELTRTSEPKAAAILQSADRLKAFRKNEDDYDFAANGQPGGGVEPAASILAATRGELDANRTLLQRNNVRGVPVVVYRRRGGGARLLVGAPSSAAELRAILAEVR